jgi:nicotinate-nucleotide adenylyltransferase
MRVAVFGGSFDPPHVGHAMVAAWLLWTDRVERVALVPVAAHPFGKRGAPFDRRLEWCRALASVLGPAVEVSDVERGLPAPSYTIQTLEALAGTCPERTFQLVVGADILGDVHRWRRWDDIETRFSPILVGRAGHPSPGGGPTFPAVSSTEVRLRLRAGESVADLVPAAVLRRITAEDIGAW